MSAPSYSWPEDLFSSSRVRAWLGDELGTHFSGPTEILYSKQWGVTAVFEDEGSDRRLVFKGSRLSVAAHGPVVHRFLAEIAPDWVPAVLATRVDDDISWTAFEPIEGRPLEDDLSTEAFQLLASTLASIQVAATISPIPRAIPRAPVALVPATLERFRESTKHHLEEWHVQEAAHRSVSPGEVDHYLRSIQRRFPQPLPSWATAAGPTRSIMSISTYPMLWSLAQG